MPDKDPNPQNEVVEFKSESTQSLVPNDTSDLTIGKTVTVDTTANDQDEPKKPKPVMYHGVEFPPYFQGPHFVEVKGSLVMAIDPSCVTMEMKSNWHRYRMELAALGKKVVENNLKIKIETV